MPSRKLEFTGHDGSRLAGRLDLPQGTPRAYALFAHCFTGSKDVLASAHISAALARAGIAVLRFDFTGLGMSEGEFANTNFSSNVADLVCAADVLRRDYRAPALLVGHSLGGAAVLAAAGRIAEVTAVATLAAPSEPAHVEQLLGAAAAHLRNGDDAVEVELFGRHFTIKRQFIEDVERTRLRDCVTRLGRALLVMHSPHDELVDIDQARQLYEAARHPKSFVSLVDANHLLTRRADAEYAAQVLAAWAARYLPALEPVPTLADPPAGSVAVVERGDAPYANTVCVGRHRLVADEPAESGGGDTGPAPHDYVLAGLGACTSMTLRMVADRKGIPLQHVSVQLTRRKLTATDRADGRSGGAGITQIQRDITLVGPLDDAQRGMLLQIADRCPVHRTLTGEIEVHTRLQD